MTHLLLIAFPIKFSSEEEAREALQEMVDRANEWVKNESSLHNADIDVPVQGVVFTAP